MKEYTVIYERGSRNWSAYVPDLPGCVATGATVEETESLLREAIALHIEGLQEDGLPIPEPSSVISLVDDNIEIIRNGKGDVSAFLSR